MRSRTWSVKVNRPGHNDLVDEHGGYVSTAVRKHLEEREVALIVHGGCGSGFAGAVVGHDFDIAVLFVECGEFDFILHHD